MVTRRNFLRSSGLGMLAFSSLCQPPMFQPSALATDFPLDALQQKIRRKHLKDLMLGYPVNMNTPADAFFAWRRELFEAGIDMFAYNNVGNPYHDSPIPYNTHDFERETIRKFGDLMRFPAQDTWGFLSHSGTDSNMHGMYMGRTLLKGRTGVLPKAYFTREAHYSVQILRDLLGLETVLVGTQPDGGMDPDDLARKLTEHADAPALVVATVGTTFKGAVDHIDALQAKLVGHASYLHVDAALFGGYLPFTPFKDEVAHRTDALENRYDSIAVSCHKFFGFPSPAGLFITRHGLYEEFNDLFSQIHDPEYIRHVPGTITCSRDAVKPAEFYYFTTPAALAKQAEDAQAMLKNASYLMDQLQAHFPQLCPARANPMSNTVYFKHPGAAIVKKYSLATMHLDVDGKREEFGHVVVMPHVTQAVLSEFLSDVEESQAVKQAS
jgi:glutamate/tyrosine decarboxylase-like PLP-dependent enzyme